MIGLKHSGEYALILSEDELVLFKAVFGANSDTLQLAVKESWRLHRIITNACDTATHLIQQDVDSDAYALIGDLLARKEDEYQTEI